LPTHPPRGLLSTIYPKDLNHVTTTAIETASPHGKEVLRDLSPLHRELRRAIPEVYQGFGELSKAAFADGALDRKTKELIALAIGVVEGCDGCVASHGQAAARAGATREEAAEAIGVTFLMHGGPATIHGARAYAAFNEFADALEAGETPA
jgi:AhpD family alkylhydroperoxidase